jgi:Ca2+-transporting ATPase
MGWPLILYPAHIVFLELIIDPACSVVFECEAEESDIMKRPPRDISKPLFSRKLWFLSLTQGLFSLIVVMVVFRLALSWGHTVESSRTFAFVTLIVSNLSLILVNRSWSKSAIASLATPNRALVWVIAGAVTFLCLVIYVPFLRRVFHFGMIHRGDLFIALAAGVLSVIWFDLVKVTLKKSGMELMRA